MDNGSATACLLVLLLSASMIMIPLAVAQESAPSTVNVTLAASADAYVDESQPQENYGSEGLLNVRSLRGDNARTYVAFDLSSIPPGASILYAHLKLRVLVPPLSQSSYLCQRVMSSWGEGSVSWANQPQASSVYGSSCAVGPSSEWVTWDVTDQVQKMVNGIPQHTWPSFGWRIFDSNEDSSVGYNASFYSREFATEANRPLLVIGFLPPEINLTMGSATIMVGTWVQITVRRTSQRGVLIAVGDRMVLQDWINMGDLSIDLSSSSSSGKFSLSEGGQVVHRVTIPNGSTQVSLYYSDESAGIQTIGASTMDFEQGYYVEASVSIDVIVDLTPPTIADITLAPANPVMGEIVEVSASITDTGSGVKEATLRFSIGETGAWTSVNMIPRAGVYVAQVPSQDIFSRVRYAIRSTDNAGNTAETLIQEFSVGIPVWVYATVIGSVVVLAFVGLKVLRKRKS